MQNIIILGLHFEPSEISTSDYLDYWLENYVTLNLRPNTISGYKNIVDNYLKSALGIYKLKSLTPGILQEFVNKKYINGCNKSTLKRINLLGFLSLSMTIEWAVRVQEDCMLSLQV